MPVVFRKFLGCNRLMAEPPKFRFWMSYVLGTRLSATFLQWETLVGEHMKVGHMARGSGLLCYRQRF